MIKYTLTNDKLLKDLVRNPEALNAFPFLRQVASVAPPDKCSSCQRKKYEAQFRSAAEGAKAHLASLPPEEVLKLKSLLKLQPTDTIQLWFLQNNETKPKTL